MDWFIFALGTAILASIAGVLTKKALFKERALQYSVALAIVNVAVSIPLIFWLEVSISGFVWLAIFFASFTAALGFLLTAEALKKLEISVVSPLRNFSPVFTAIFAFFLLSENLTAMHAVGVGALILGSYILQINFKKGGPLQPLKKLAKSKYIHLLFIALVSYGFSSVAGKYSLSYVSPITLLFFMQFFIAIIFMFYMVFIRENGIQEVKEGFKKSGWLILLIAIITVSYRLLQNQAMSMQYVSLVIPIKRLSSLFSTIIGGELFHEEGIIHKSIACIIMIIGATLIVLG